MRGRGKRIPSFFSLIFYFNNLKLFSPAFCLTSFPSGWTESFPKNFAVGRSLVSCEPEDPQHTGLTQNPWPRSSCSAPCEGSSLHMGMAMMGFCVQHLLSFCGPELGTVVQMGVSLLQRAVISFLDVPPACLLVFPFWCTILTAVMSLGRGMSCQCTFLQQTDPQEHCSFPGNYNSQLHGIVSVLFVFASRISGDYYGYVSLVILYYESM